MMTFTKQHSHFASIKQEPMETITVTTSSEGLHEVISAFERFLLGCGYALDGNLEFVYDDEVTLAADDGAGSVEMDRQWVNTEGEVYGDVRPFQWTEGREMIIKEDPNAPSIYEDGYESPSNGAQSDWPFPTGKTP